MSIFSDSRWAEALGHLPDYLGNHGGTASARRLGSRGGPGGQRIWRRAVWRMDGASRLSSITRL